MCPSEIWYLKQFDSTDEICIHRIVEQTVHQVIQSRQEDIRSIWRSFSTFHLDKNKQMTHRHNEEKAEEVPGGILVLMAYQQNLQSCPSSET